MVSQDHQVKLATHRTGDEIDLFQHRSAGKAGDLHQLTFQEAAVEPARAVSAPQRIEHLADGGINVGRVRERAAVDSMNGELRVTDGIDLEDLVLVPAQYRPIRGLQMDILVGCKVIVDEATDIGPGDRVPTSNRECVGEHVDGDYHDGMLKD